MTYSVTDEVGTTKYWDIPRLWEESKQLQIESKNLSNYSLVLKGPLTWCSPQVPMSFQGFLDHMTQTLNAELSYPILLDKDGNVIDGMHRLAKAFLSHQKTILVKQFKEELSPDRVTYS